ncbi:MAG TPA: hypothetical protein VIS76_05465 [Pseudomonadales bacterium]
MTTRIVNRTAGRAVLALLCAALLSACDSADRNAARDTEAPPVPTPAPAPGFHLPVSLNEVMVALVNRAADPIWLAAWQNPQTDRDWRELEYQAYQLQLAGALLVIPGNGPMDDEWTANPQWTAWANRLQAAGERAVKAVSVRDLERISRSGDEIVEVCEGCHVAFKPDLPTSGMFGELSPTAEDFQDEGEATP